MHKPQSAPHGDVLASLSALFALAVWFVIFCLVEPAAAAERFAPSSDFLGSTLAAEIFTLLLPLIAFVAGGLIGMVCLANSRRPIEPDFFLEAQRRADHEFSAAERDHPDVAAYIRASARRAKATNDGSSALHGVAGVFFPIATLTAAASILVYFATAFFS